MKALRQVVVCVVTVGILLFGVTPEVLAASKTTSAVKVIKFKNLAYSHSGQKATVKGNFSVSQRSGTRYKFTGTVKKVSRAGIQRTGEFKLKLVRGRASTRPGNI